MKQRRTIILILVMLILISCAGYVAYVTLIQGVNSGPDLVEALQNGLISTEEITAVRVLRQSPGTWPFSESDYSRLQTVRLPKQPTAEVLQAIREFSVLGYTHRNHPATIHSGMLRFDTAPGDHYYVYYQIGSYEGRQFTWLKANTANSTNPNGATAYENIPSADLLSQHDPWHPPRDNASELRPETDR
jgi:hypothetical protein